MLAHFSLAFSIVGPNALQASIILKTFSDDKLAEAKTTLIERYGRRIMHGILCGLAGVAPRSVIPNLITLMLSLLTRCPTESRAWIREILYAVCFFLLDLPEGVLYSTSDLGHHRFSRMIF